MKKNLGTVLFLAAALYLASGERAVADGGAWRVAGFLTTVRGGHTATVLPNGKVLFVGGLGRDSVLASAELFDPQTGALSPAGSLHEARLGHTATLLPNGEVLVVGGVDEGFDSLATAEVYDIGTSTWRRTGPLHTQRSGHTATLLADGKVLVVGGNSGGRDMLAYTELYDPAAGTWSPGRPLRVARAGHTATLLPNGKVLVLGGLIGFVPRDTLADAELYDPLTGSWRSTRPMSVKRQGQTATLLPDGRVLVAGGRTANVFLASSELYDPTHETWEATGDLREGRSEHTAALLPDGRVLVIGGMKSLDAFFGDSMSAELYDAQAGVWLPAPPLPLPRREHSTTVLPSGVLVAGGLLGLSFSIGLDDIELYDPQVSTWTAAAPLAPRSFGHQTTLLPDGTVLDIGIVEEDPTPRPSFSQWEGVASIFNPATGNWSLTAPLLDPHYRATETLLPDGSVLVVGGEDRGAALDSAETYDPAARSWTPAGRLTNARRDHTATLLADGRVLVVGGRLSTSSPNAPDSLATAEIYDPATRSWTPTRPLLSGHRGHTATPLGDGRILVVGGNGTDLTQVPATAEIYDPTTAAWTAAGSLATARQGHAAVLLPNGRVLVVGGCSGITCGATASAEIFDPVVERWFLAGALTTTRNSRVHTALLLPSGRVLVLGGGNPGQDPASAEIYDPMTGSWQPAPSLASLAGRSGLSATLLPDGRVLVTDRATAACEIYDPLPGTVDRRPRISAVGPFQFGSPLTITGTGFQGDSEASGGNTGSSAVNYPLVQLRSLESSSISWLVPDPRRSFADDPMTLTVSDLPSELATGWYALTVVTAGVPSLARLVRLPCGLVITRQPQDQTGVPIGGTATFRVTAQGGRTFQWQKDGIDIPGAVGPSYTTPPVAAQDSGASYRVAVQGACASEVSQSAVLTIEDHEPPQAAVVQPDGGEYWLLSTPGSSPNHQVVTWSMTDNIRVCEAEVSLWYSKDGGATYVEAPPGGGLPAHFGSGVACPAPGERATSLDYTVPSMPPSGTPGSLYEIRLRVKDQAGLETLVRSRNPFFIVQPNPDVVRTLILVDTARMRSVMGITPAQEAALVTKLRDLSRHPRVLGQIVDLNGVTDLSQPTEGLYALWDAHPEDSDAANRVLFGCHPPLPTGCTQERDGIHDVIHSLLAVYSGVRYLVLVGDDRVIPMARLRDRTVLLPESSYPAGGDLTATGTSVGRALAAGLYLSDDPLAGLDPVRPDALSGAVSIPDLAVGRLVETPEEIITTIATFISKDGVLDLSGASSEAEHKVLVTGYDFLLDTAARVRDLWRRALGAPADATSTAPLDATLVSASWGASSTAARRDLLRARLAGNGKPYGLVFLNGHAAHHEEGVPGDGPFDIQGLSTADLFGPDACNSPSQGGVNLAGSVLISSGCHGGLPVAGSCASDAEHSLDLPQTLLSRGALAYLSNTGYGWGLAHGIGYGERLIEILAEELTAGGTIVTGEAARKAKLRYFLEAPRFDPYDEKSLMQWTFFGLPMYAVKTGNPVVAAVSAGDRAGVEPLGAAAVVRRSDKAAALDSALPPFLTRLDLHFDLGAPGVYTKRNAAGEKLPEGSGCPDPEGCYYTLNGLVERGTGLGDLPIVPYLIYDSRLSGTSQHGVLWKGGAFDEQEGWVPVFGELVSNQAGRSDHGATPRRVFIKPTAPRWVSGEDPDACRTSDLEAASLVVTTGEVLKKQSSDLLFSVERHYRSLDLEVFYFNDRETTSNNCDRTGPVLGTGPFQGQYHQVQGTTLEWAVPATDPAGVWRVVVVFEDGSRDAGGRRRWQSLDLTADGGTTWHGQVDVAGSSAITYVVQAVDRRGNLTWLDFVAAELPASGVPLDIPLSVDVPLAFGQADLSVAVSDAPDPVNPLDPLSYRIQVTNLGPSTATSLQVSAELPSGAQLVLAGGAGWTCEEAAGVVGCSRDRLEVGAAAPLSVFVAPRSGPGELQIRVTAAAREGDPDPASNSALERTRVRGDLTPAGTLQEPIIGLAGAEAVTVSPDGRHVYVASSSANAVLAFARDAVTGALQPVQALSDGSGGIEGLAGARAVAVSPEGGNVYVASSGAGAVAAFTRNAETGGLTFLQALFDGRGGVDGLGGAASVAVSSDGRHVYVASAGDGAIAVFRRDPRTGSLAFVEAVFDGVDGVTGLRGARAIAITPDRKHVYAVGRGSSGGGAVAGFENLLSKAPCASGLTTLCLVGGRFEVEVDWRDPRGNVGAGRVVPFSSDTSGLFWFFAAENWEVLVKVLDGCSLNDRFWLFASAATTVEYTLRVTDRLSNKRVEYFHPSGSAAGVIADTEAFAACP